MRAALYIDLDNMLGYCYSLGYQFKPRALVSYIESQGNDLVRAKSFGSIQTALLHLNSFMGESSVNALLSESGIEHVSCTGKKNSADLALSLDAMTEQEEYDILYVLSSDADFCPLIDKVSDLGKQVVCIKMFRPSQSEEELKGKEVYYHDVLGTSVAKGLDVKVLVYRDIIESVLKMPLVQPEYLTEVMEEAKANFKPGITLNGLASSISKKEGYKILRTALYGKAFLSDPADKNTLLAIREGLLGLRAAYYRQCQFILKRYVKSPINEEALNKMFMLKQEKFSLATRRLEVQNEV